MKRKIRTVAVSGLHRGENPQPGPSVIAGLRRRFPEIRVIGLSYDPLESSLYGSGFDHPDAAYLIPYPGAGQHALLERLLVVAEKEDVGAVIPCLDSEIENYISIQEELKRVGIDCILPTMASFNARHKAFLPAFCERIGVSVPTTRIATNAAEIDFYAQELGYPVYVKGRLYDAHLVNSPSELVGAYSGIVRVWGWPIIVQEVVVGEEYDITGVGDGKGKILHSCSIRKLLRTSSGKGYGGIVVENPELDEIAAENNFGIEVERSV